MKKAITIFTVLSLFVFGTSFAKIVLDGDNSDWAEVTGGVQDWVNGEEGLYPDDVGAIVTDNVDIKHVKAKIHGNVLYWYVEFHGGPAWPNNAYTDDWEGEEVVTSRGYYHLMVDLDNNAETGWKSDWYEAHYTTVGYLASQEYEDAEPLGAEIYLGWGGRYWYPAPHKDSAGIKNNGVRSLGYEIDDCSEYDGVSDNDLFFDMADFEIPNPDSSDGMLWHGSLINQISHTGAPDNDSLRSFFVGHAWGEDFGEFAYEITPIKEYFMNKNGSDYFNEGDVIAIAGFIETPADGWGVDISTRGEITCPQVPPRPSSITFDGDNSDWADVPFAVQDWVNGEEGLYPDDVGAIVTDNVDIKDVKAMVNPDEGAMYWYLTFHAGPAWPNNAYTDDWEGEEVVTSRGYYHLMVDLDNDAETGWKSDWYEAHYTTVGYLASQAVEGAEPLGAEIYLGWGGRYWYPAPHKDSAGIKNNGVRSLGYEVDDCSEYDGVSDNDLFFDIGGYDISKPDSTLGMMFDGLLVNQEGVDESLVNDRPTFHAHGWGSDFVEFGHSIAEVKQYFMNKNGTEYFNDGDVIAVAGFVETPADGWGVDISTRGEVTIGAGSAVADNPAVLEEFSLSANYPNPFNPTTAINYNVPVTTDISLVIYNSLGQAVRTLVDERVPAGKHTISWDGLNDAGLQLSSGVYFYTLKSESFTQTRKMMLLK